MLKGAYTKVNFIVMSQLSMFNNEDKIVFAQTMASLLYQFKKDSYMLILAKNIHILSLPPLSLSP